MPRANREETKEKKVPFKKCAGTNCRDKWEFYDSNTKISFCRKCKITYFWTNEAIKIKDKFLFIYIMLFLLFNTYI